MIEDSPQIYVACLSAYNNGKLHGEWIDADQHPDDIMEEIKEMLKNSPEADAEEFAIHDYQGFYDIQIHEYESIEKLSILAKLITKHGEPFTVWLLDKGGVDEVDDESEDEFIENYHGEQDSEVQYAENLMTDCYEIPDFLESYINWDKWARDLFLSDYWSERSRSGSVYVFCKY